MKRELLPPEVRKLHGKDTIFLIDTSPDQENPATNGNQLTATEILLRRINTTKGPIVACVAGAMGSGKSTVTLLLKGELGDSCQLFKQRVQVGFDGAVVKTHGGLKGQPAKPFNTLTEVVTTADREVVIAEESQFAPTTQEELKGVERIMGARGIRALVLTGLNFDFRKVPWKSMTPVLERANPSIVLTARCVRGDNHDPAFFTQRTIFYGGKERPACYDDPVVLAGNVGEDGRVLKERYDPMCTSCHRVLPAARSRELSGGLRNRFR